MSRGYSKKARSIIDASEEEKWSKPVMSIAVALKAISRYSKDQKYNVFVLERCVDDATLMINPKYINDSKLFNRLMNSGGNDELAKFLDVYHQNFKKLREGFRCLLLVKNPTNH